jgi:hypothetical protein
MLNKVFIDFNNADKKGRVRLNSNGTLNDLKNKNIELIEGKEILLDDEDGLATAGIVQFSEEENIWVAVIDWQRVRHSEE